ncbi:MAG: glutamine--tRNA ligase/YqeY domain fusion protein [Myxococcota bacterium]
MPNDDAGARTDFIREAIAEDLSANKNDGRVVTRFPPDPNGYLLIGHAKAICLNFDVARENGGACHLRFDDTNPSAESLEYVEAMKEDIRWLGYDWGEHLYYASDYFDQLYEVAVRLVEACKAYVCDLSVDEIREYRGTITEPGRNSPYRDRPVEENLDLLSRMKAGEFEDGSRVLRARIDMASPNMTMRDPVLYRIQRIPHYRTGSRWCIYPMYDFAHPLSDAIEGITHSLCSLEFEARRELYDWVVRETKMEARPRQIEFARMNLSHTIVGKRFMRPLVERGLVTGWDDPRMPSLRAMRRRGYTSEAIRKFCAEAGIAKRENTIAMAQLEHAVREDLNRRVPRAFAVLRPLRLVIENYPEDQVEELEAVNNPEDPAMGTRKVPFSRVLYVERDDFREDPPRKFFRLAPGREVRLRYAYLVRCTDFVKDASGEVVEVRCTYDPETRGGSAPDGRRVKGTLHWVSAAHALQAEVRLYGHLFRDERPRIGEDEDVAAFLNPDSLEVLSSCPVEPSLGGAEPGSRFQFERQGYFCVDPDSSENRLVFNRTVSLRDTWARMEKRGSSG